MADIELVIKIPEKEYKNICLMSKDGIGMALYDWIANGTPLPKGHGRLIDADELYSDFIDGTEGYDCQTWSRVEIGDIIDNASTIIEADSDICPCIWCHKIINSEYCSKGCPDYQKWSEGRENEQDK